MNPEIEQLKNQIDELVEWKKSLESSANIPLMIEQSFRARLGITTGLNQLLTLTGIIKGSVGTFTAITPLSGTKTYYVSDSSGGAVTRKLTFTNGILTAET